MSVVVFKDKPQSNGNYQIKEEALKVTFNTWVDEKGTKDHPGVWQRRPSKLSFDEAYDIIKDNKPHWTIIYRDMSIFNDMDSYWDFGGCNIRSNDYGEVFIWIQVSPEEAEKIFEKFNLKIHIYGDEKRRDSNF